MTPTSRPLPTARPLAAALALATLPLVAPCMLRAQAATVAPRPACTTPDAARPVRDLEPASLRYQGTFTVPERSMAIGATLTVRAHPAGGWAVAERATLPRGVAVDSARLDAGTLAPRERTIAQGAMRVSLTFTDTLVAGTVTAGGETHAVAAATCGSLFGDGAGAFLVLGRLPLAPDYRVTLRHLDLRTAAVARRELAVLGSERITVAAGTFDTWKVELRDEGNPAATMIWVDKVSRVPVRFVTVQGTVTVTQELAP